MLTKRKRVEIGPACIYYQQAGSGEPLVLVHGLSGSGRWWARNIRYLAQRYTVYVIDLIGFGGSRGRHRFLLDEASYYLSRWMDVLDIEDAIVVGHSMGGVIAIDLAARHPVKVSRLVLVDTAALAYERTLFQNVTGLIRAVYRLPMSFIPVLLMDAWRAGPFTILRAAYDLLMTDITGLLERIRCPVLIVWGDRDAIVPLQIGERLHKHLEDSRMIVISGAGHNPMWDRAREFNLIIGEFLRESIETVRESANE